MDPITIGILGSAAVSGLAQYLSSEKGRKASKAELDKVSALFSKLEAPQYDERGTPLPQYDITTITPEDYKVLQQYVPEVAKQVKEVAPELIKETGDMKTGRQAQMDALNRLRQVGSGEGDPEFAAKMAQASRQSSIDAQSKIDSILQSQARRGILGSGNQLAAQLQGATSSMDRAAEMGTNAAAESYRNQLQALRDSANLGGQVRSQDEGMQARNADIINSYNARGAASGQAWQNNRAATINEGNRYNIGVAQTLDNQNKDRNYDAARDTRDTGNELRRQTYLDTEARRDSLNRIRAQKFGDQRDIAAGLAGSYQGQSANHLQTAADRNQAIGGLGSAVSGALMYGNSQDRADKRYDKIAAAGGNPLALNDNSTRVMAGDPYDELKRRGEFYA